MTYKDIQELAKAKANEVHENNGVGATNNLQITKKQLEVILVNFYYSIQMERFIKGDLD